MRGGDVTVTEQHLSRRSSKIEAVSRGLLFLQVAHLLTVTSQGYHLLG